MEANALCSRLPTVSCRLSATRPKRLYAITILPRRAYAVRIASNYRRDTILQGSEHGPASTCWSLLSSSSAAIVSLLGLLAQAYHPWSDRIFSDVYRLPIFPL